MMYNSNILTNSTNIVGSPRKRNASNPSAYKVNKVKLARLKGQSYINRKGNEVPPRHPKFACR